MRMLCLPIDSRPCNTQFVRRIAEHAGSEFVLPPREIMDEFTCPADFRESFRFLEQELPRADAAVVSLDHLCYGSLLASREETVTEAEALERVAMLRTLLKAHPGIPVYLSTVILRSSLSALSRDDLAVYHAMTEYSVYSDRVSRFGLPEDAARLRAAREKIPAEILERTMRVRRRNLRVNLAAVDLAAEGLPAGLSILQEDCQEYGLPKEDQRKIEKRLREKGLSSVRIRNGTDEAGAVLAARALLAGRPFPEAEIRWVGDGSFIAPYEDRPFRENLLLACREAGVRPVPSSDRIICVLCPEHGEQLDTEDPVPPAWLSVCARAADEAVREGKQVYLLDCNRANGGVPELFRHMRETDRLWGYSAWNTASNAAGTLLAQVVADDLAGGPDPVFFQERLLDDLVYQGRIRTMLNAELAALREDIYHLRDGAAAEERLRCLFRQELPGCWPLRSIPEYSVSLPWPRTFEILAEIGKTNSGA